MEKMLDLIETARLTLRRWQLDDVGDVLAYAGDSEWSRYLRALPVPYTRRAAEEFVARQVLLDPAVHPAWAIVLKGTVVGGINLRFQFDHRVGELGYSIARTQWNRGYATEASLAVLDEAFRAYADLKRIRAFADARNASSRKVLEKIWMREEGLLRQNRFERGELVDEAWYGVLREEWEARSELAAT